MKILVPLDGSPLAETILSAALRMAHLSRTPVTFLLLRAIKITDWSVSPMEANSLFAYEAIQEEAQVACLDYLRHIQQRPEWQGQSVETKVVFGDAAEMIVQVAKESQIDIILMATHGRTGNAEKLLGSVTNAVLQTTQIPILVIPPHAKALLNRTETEMYTILVPLDGSVRAELALPWASAISHLWYGQMRLLRVVPLQADDQTQEALDYLSGVMRRLEQPDLAVHLALARGEAGTQIVADATTNHADMIVMLHQQMSIKFDDTSSVTAKVLQHVQCPLFIIPSHSTLPAKA